MKLSAIAAFAALLMMSPSLAPASPAGSDAIPSNQLLVCGTAVGIRFLGEVKSSKESDKYMHCAISCVITNYCGPVEATAVGALKEIYDAMGFGDPEVADFEADLKGVKAGMRIGPFGDREECYRACSKLFP